MSDIWHDPLFLAALKKGGAVGSVSGDIVTFNAPKAAPLKALTLSIDPVQDLHGYDNPWPAGGGKNKFNIADVTINEIQTVSGNTITKAYSAYNFDLLNGTTGASSLATKKISLAAGAYTISGAVTSDSSVGVRVYIVDSDGVVAETHLVAINANTPYATFTLSESGYITLRYSAREACTVSNIQIESGSTATTYAPYSNLCPISGWDGANLWRTGANVWDEEWEEGTINATTGANQLGPNYWRTKNYIPVKPNTSYVICASESNKATRLRFYDGQKAFIGVSPASGSGYSGTPFTTPSNVYYLRFAPDKNVIPEPNQNVSVNYPSTPTTYAPYTGTAIPITFTEAGTVYGGTWDVLNGVLRVVYRFLNAADVTWRKSGDVVYYAPSDLYTTVSADTPTGRKPLLCNTFSYYSGSSVRDGDIGYGGINNNGNITIRSSVVAFTLEDWNDYIANNTVQIIYPLATPITYTLTPQQLDTLAGANVVWGDSGAVSLEYAGGGVSKDMMLAAILHEARQ